MEMTRLNPPGVLEHPRFTRIISVDGPMTLCYFAGQTPQRDDMGPIAPGDFRAQYIFVMEKIAVQLKAVGASWDNVTHRKLYLTDWDAWEKVRDDPTLPRYFSDDKLPCSTAIGVTRLSHPDFLLEIDVVAAVPAK